MSFYKYREDGSIIRNSQSIVDWGELITEQSHKDTVNINNIIKKHGVDLIAKTTALQQFVYDDVTGNDFQESMNMLIKARDSFETLPSELRKRMDNDPAKFMDWIHNPDNHQEMISMGLMEPESSPPQPIKVVMVDSETGEPIMKKAEPQTASQPAEAPTAPKPA